MTTWNDIAKKVLAGEYDKLESQFHKSLKMGLQSLSSEAGKKAVVHLDYLLKTVRYHKGFKTT